MHMAQRVVVAAPGSLVLIAVAAASAATHPLCSLLQAGLILPHPPMAHSSEGVRCQSASLPHLKTTVAQLLTARFPAAAGLHLNHLVQVSCC
jgi:hypothetical protein